MDIEILPKDLDFLVALQKATAQDTSREQFLKSLFRVCRSRKEFYSIEQVIHIYKKYQLKIPAIDKYGVKLSVRSHSGVVVITIVLKPFDRSCTFDCYYCADERISNGAVVDVPRSYHSSEPAVRRAIFNQYDIARQFWDRADSLRKMGHPIDKIEIILLGGTFSVYERSYQEHVFQQIFYAANTLKEGERDSFTLEEEQLINETANARIIGIVVETRPVCISRQELMRYRRWGITRVQIGVQHTDDKILEYVNRRHGVRESITAIRLLKDFGFKVDIHVMPDLPGANPEADKEMFRRVLTEEEFVVDYMKIYPCLDVKFAKIRDWKEDGRWQPYAEKNQGEDLIQVLLYAKSLIPRYLRINRVQRDFIPETGTEPGYVSNTIQPNLRQILLSRMTKPCLCIRCREIKDREVNPEDAKLKITKYRSSGGWDYFIEFIIPEKDTLIGFIRLRLPPKDDSVKHILPELRGSALIRELHVFGRTHRVDTKNQIQTQHLGFGSRLINEAERIAKQNGYSRIAVISGVGVREYYRKKGYSLEGTYMVKTFREDDYIGKMLWILLFAFIFGILHHFKNQQF